MAIDDDRRDVFRFVDDVPGRERPGDGAEREPRCRAEIKCRAEARRAQVLEAADACFRRQGFHSASMADISRRAGMSPGHIYHYFENKEAIIACIVRADLEDVMGELARSQEEGGDLVSFMLSRVEPVIEEHLDKCHASLILEILAEAGRNPKVAALLQEADREIRGKLREVLLNAGAAKTEAEQADLNGKVEVLIMIFKGLLSRAVANPDVDRDSLARVMKSTIQHLLG